MINTIKNSYNYLGPTFSSIRAVAAKTREDFYRQGIEPIACTPQWKQLCWLLDGVDNRIVHENKLKLSLVSLIFVISVQVLTRVLENRSEMRGSILQSGVQLIHNRIGSICQIAILANNIFRLRRGHTDAILAIAISSLGFLRRQQLLTAQMDAIYDSLQQKLATTVSILDIFFSEGILMKMLAIVQIYPHVNKLLNNMKTPYQAIPYCEEKHGKHLL